MQHDNFWDSVVFVAEIKCSQDEGLSSNSKILESELYSKIRTKDCRTNHYIDGVIKNIETVYENDTYIDNNKRSEESDIIMRKNISIVFNEKNVAWHYDWVSNKHISFTYHVFDIVIFVSNGTGILHHIGSYQSPPFRVVSTKLTQTDPMFREGYTQLSTKEDDNVNKQVSKKKGCKLAKDKSIANLLLLSNVSVLNAKVKGEKKKRKSVPKVKNSKSNNMAHNKQSENETVETVLVNNGKGTQSSGDDSDAGVTGESEENVKDDLKVKAKRKRIRKSSSVTSKENWEKSEACDNENSIKSDGLLFLHSVFAHVDELENNNVLAYFDEIENLCEL